MHVSMNNGKTTIRVVDNPHEDVPDNTVKIMTHNGKFHMDEIVAIATLLLSEYKDAPDVTILRSRDLNMISTSDYILDVGGVYEPSEGRFDHHQLGFDVTYPNGQKYATAGLVWIQYGEEVIRNVLAESFPDDADDVCLRDAIYDRVASILQAIDAVDNGGAPDISTPPIIKTIISLNMRPLGIDPKILDPMVATDFIAAVITALSWLRCRVFDSMCFIQSADVFAERLEQYKGKEYIVVPKSVPWREYMYKDWDVFRNFKFVVVEHPPRFVINTVPKSKLDRKTPRVSVPRQYLGKKYDELERHTGIDGSWCTGDGRVINCNNWNNTLRMIELLLR